MPRFASFLRRAGSALGLAALPLAAQTVVLDTFNLTGASGTVTDVFSWPGQVQRNATSITVGGSALDLNGWGASGLAIDASALGYVRLAARRDAGNAAAALVVQLEDATLNTTVVSAPASAFSTTEFTRVQITLGAWPAGFAPATLSGWNIGGGTVGVAPFRFTLEHLELAATLLPLDGGTIVTVGHQRYGTAQNLSGPTVLRSASATERDVAFAGALDGAHGLTIETGGVVSFGAAVGAAVPLAAFETDAGGKTVVAGGLVRTTGAQIYRDSVELGAATAFRSLVDGGLRFFETLFGEGYAVEFDTAAAGSLRRVENVASFTKSGAGTLTLDAASTYAGPTRVLAGTLALGTAQALPSGSALTLGGGTLALRGLSQTLASLSVSASSTIDFGRGTAALVFGDSAALAWLSPVTVANYNSSLNLLQFGSTAAALTTQQLGLLRFADYGGVPGTIDGLGRVTPDVTAIPEPSAWAALAGLVALLTVGRRAARRR